MEDNEDTDGMNEDEEEDDDDEDEDDEFDCVRTDDVLQVEDGSIDFVDSRMGRFVREKERAWKSALVLLVGRLK